MSQRPSTPYATALGALAVLLGSLIVGFGTPALSAARQVQDRHVAEVSAASTGPLMALFKAAFGHSAPFVSTAVPTRPQADQVTYWPRAVVHLGRTLVLVSSGDVEPDCHGCSGLVTIHYLRRVASGYRVMGGWAYSLQSTWGRPPDLLIRRGLFRWPTLATEGFWPGDCDESWSEMVELTPARPVWRAYLRTDLDSMIIRPGRTADNFTVIYPTHHARVVYRKVGWRYRPSRGVDVRQCSFG